ncbi:SnoaL-like domain-containing protein [Chitinophaga solisilvae]|uniref:SnoaL-like domain-containing protein n=1 Tax=Chitinophaga solisilvae TaxID=1233460 RepID=UPI00136C6A46|nr:SnoaL-like domain-containing protein [Chitinophaga solisilvae]
MTVQEIAIKLAEYCRTEKYEQAQQELYAADVISIEPDTLSGFEKETHGLQNILEKGRKFQGMVETSYGSTVSAPLVAGNSFAFTLTMDLKMKGRERSQMSELCVYVVQDGKVVSEQFFW